MRNRYTIIPIITVFVFSSRMQEYLVSSGASDADSVYKVQ